MALKLLPLLPPLPLPMAVLLALAILLALLLLHFGLGRKGLRLRVALYPEPSLQLLNVRLPPWLLRRLNRGLSGRLPLQVEGLLFRELRLAPAAWTKVKIYIGCACAALNTHTDKAYFLVLIVCRLFTPS